jgi:hypothetical protein
MVVAGGDDLAGRAGRGLMIGSMTKDVVGAAGVIGGVRSTELSCCIDGDADVRRSIVHPASGTTRTSPIAIKAIQRSIPRSGSVSRKRRPAR